MPFEPRFKTLVEVFQASVGSFADRPLFGTKRGDAWVWTTYGEFGRQVDRFRGGLASLGVGPGDRVAMIANNRVEWAVVAYACYGLGAAFVPMYEAQNAKEWEFIVRDCEAKVLFVATPAILGALRGMLDATTTLKTIALLDGDGGGGGDERVTTYARSSRAPRASRRSTRHRGTSRASSTRAARPGNPKGVMLTHLNLASNVSAIS